mmetsp:Transcript_8111/g.20252  ORF Transcript_8111/g.20252 Transcript_8111/m.20252 type:complete len:234 (-) Transcript_8111:2071-2772(-)
MWPKSRWHARRGTAARARVACAGMRAARSPLAAKTSPRPQICIPGGALGRKQRNRGRRCRNHQIRHTVPPGSRCWGHSKLRGSRPGSATRRRMHHLCLLLHCVRNLLHLHGHRHERKRMRCQVPEFCPWRRLGSNLSPCPRIPARLHRPSGPARRTPTAAPTSQADSRPRPPLSTRPPNRGSPAGPPSSYWRWRAPRSQTNAGCHRSHPPACDRSPQRPGAARILVERVVGST